jgi:hypothetical protein
MAQTNTTPYTCRKCCTEQQVFIQIPVICNNCKQHSIFSKSRDELACDEIQTSFWEGMLVGIAICIGLVAAYLHEN